MITGRWPATTRVDKLLTSVTIGVATSPFLMMGAGMLVVGALAVGPRKDAPELLICLPAGFALLAAAAVAIYVTAWRMPALTVTRFAYDGGELVVETPFRGTITTPAAGVRVVDSWGGRGRGLVGWWLRPPGHGWVYLTAHTPNAESLVARLRAAPSGGPPP